ncbi:MAG: hypothetical protein M1829_006023 [Trizodia sp. TS-e1964]|nr:MAG: hypothetical protein M1829_006023 [Trizodia sp. TS-e1964]
MDKEEIDKLFQDPLFQGIDAGSTDASRVVLEPIATPQSDEDMLAELGILAAKPPQRPESRPQTPKLPVGVATASWASPKRLGTATPPLHLGSGRTSEEKPGIGRKSGDSARSFHTSLTPHGRQDVVEDGADEESGKRGPSSSRLKADQAPAASSDGGWWGGIVATASAAVKTAEAAVKEIQQNEEAKRWAEQVKGNVGALKGLGDELRSRALPTFTNILHTLAPPISSHERLQIHITHDFRAYPSLDAIIYQTFSRVMAQVEGGDLMVIQRGHESSLRRESDAGASSMGWSDGPWWRSSAERRNIGAVNGLVEGTKLVRVSAEAYANDHFSARGGIQDAVRRSTETVSESNPVRDSDIFLAIQAISQTASPELFGGPAKNEDKGGVMEPEEKVEELISFAIYLYDPIHSISYHTLTQTIPAKWIEWLDAAAPAAADAQDIPSSPSTGIFGQNSHESQSLDGLNAIPEEIAEIIKSGGVDPREWVAEWLEELLALGVGIVAQRYVARRMGVGHGGIGRGKGREAILESGAGEVARAI